MKLVHAVYSAATLRRIALQRGCPEKATFFFDEEYVIPTIESVVKEGRSIMDSVRKLGARPRRNAKDCTTFAGTAASLLHESHAAFYDGEHSVAIGRWAGISKEYNVPHSGSVAFTPPLPGNTDPELTFFEPQDEMSVCDVPEQLFIVEF